MRTRLLFLALGHALCAPLSADAQARDDALSYDAVEAILRNVDGPEHLRVVPGARLPDSVAARVSLPPGTTVLAVLASSRTRLIAAVPGEPDSVRLWFAYEFERRGYLPVEMTGMRRPTFRSAEPSPSNGGYCAGTMHFEVSAQAVTPGRVEFVLTVDPHGQCVPWQSSPTAGGWSSGRGGAPPDLPLLHHPRSVAETTMCTRAEQEGSSRQLAVPISTTLPVTEIMAHYDRQLDRLGWTRTAGAISTWIKRDSTGRDVHLALSLETGPGGVDCRVARMEARRTSR